MTTANLEVTHRCICSEQATFKYVSKPFIQYVCQTCKFSLPTVIYMEHVQRVRLVKQKADNSLLEGLIEYFEDRRAKLAQQILESTDKK